MSDGQRGRKPGRKSDTNTGFGAWGVPEVRPRNWLEPIILLTLRQWNSYGYELMERTVAFGFGAMNPGTMYRTLRKMEENGSVTSEWETQKGGPARRVYSITDAGEAYLKFWIQAMEQYQRNIDAFFSLYRAGGKRRTNDAKKKDE